MLSGNVDMTKFSFDEIYPLFTFNLKSYMEAMNEYQYVMNEIYHIVFTFVSINNTSK